MPAWGARPRSKSVTEACLWLMVMLLRPPLPSKGHKWVPEPGALPSIPEAGATLPAPPPTPWAGSELGRHLENIRDAGERALARTPTRNRRTAPRSLGRH